MSLTIPKIEAYLNSFNWTEPSYPGLASTVTVKTQPQIKNITKCVFSEGTFTPNNDYLYLRQSILLADSPNFLILICSSQLNITLTAPSIGFLVYSLPIIKVWNFFLPKDTPYIMDGIYIEGRTSVPAPMPQGEPVDYFVISGQADIT